MSIWIEIVNQLLQAQAATVETCTTQGAICPASSFNPVAAAFATQGYFMQADVLYYLTATSFGVWAPLFMVLYRTWNISLVS
jgi:hypothetical protein